MQNVLRTKLFIPPTPSELIPRPRLVEQLNQGQQGKLSLVIAPAGYGKTTLVTTWLNQLSDTQIAWLSLDENDNDTQRFFTYFLAALTQLDASFAEMNEELLQNLKDGLSVDRLMTSLLNQVAEVGKTAVLVLDDYHEIQVPAIHEAFSFWLDNQPPNIQLVLTSRTEPPLPLPRLRVRRQVTEIGTAELRFTRSESADFLNHHMHLNLSAEDIDQLDTITEGWVASLQLAALSLQNNDDPSQFIQTFKGDNRYIVDYLVHEVLQRQPGYIRDFLLQTSVLERLNVQLCNAVTGQVGSQHILETLDQSRLFVIPLDGNRHWYRYHHLFAECLQAELKRTSPDEVAAYHERASHWYNENGFLREAIHHAFAADNQELAANLIATNARTMHWIEGEMRQLWQWIQQLPEDAVHASPQLLVSMAWLYLELYLDRSARVDEFLLEAKALVNVTDAPYSAVELANIETDIELAKAALERLRGNIAEAIQHCQRATELIGAGDSQMLKVGARGSLAVNYFHAGNVNQCLARSEAQLATVMRDMQLNYARYVFLSFIIDAFHQHGQLGQAENIFKRIEPVLEQRQSIGSAMFLLSWADVLRERNQLAAAEAYLLPALEKLKPLQSMAVVVQTGARTLARVYQAQGKGQEAIQLLQDTLRDFRAPDTYYPSARISATEALLHLQQGNLPVAKAWAEKHHLQADDEPSYLLEIDYLVFARLLIAEGIPQSALKLLEKLEESTTEGGRITRLIEVKTLQALAHQALGEQEKALTILGQAVKRAEPEGFIRIFVDIGDTLVPLLKKIAGRGIAILYLKKLLPLFESVPQSTSSSVSTTLTPEASAALPTDLPLLLNPLTDRELATLRYLASNMTIPEIAEQMVVAPSTVRTYVKRIYSKLDVHTRIEAVNRARSLSLID